MPSSPQQPQHDDDEMELLPAKRNKTVTKILSLGEEVDVENEQLTLISGYKVMHSSILQQMSQSVSKC